MNQNSDKDLQKTSINWVERILEKLAKNIEK